MTEAITTGTSSPAGENIPISLLLLSKDITVAAYVMPNMIINAKAKTMIIIMPIKESTDFQFFSVSL